MGASGRRLSAVILVLALFSVAIPAQIKDTVPAGAVEQETTAFLDQAAKRLHRYYGDLLNISCDEVVRQQELQPDLMTPKGKSRELVYDFMITRQENQPALEINELRQLKLADGKPVKAKDRPKCTDPRTAYASLSLFLLPNEKSNYIFSAGGEMDLQGRNVRVINFIPAKYVEPEIKWKGTCFTVYAPHQKEGKVYIDTETYDVLRIDLRQARPFEVKTPKVFRSGIFWRLAPSRTLKFERSDLTIRFRHVEFENPKETLLLPEYLETLTIIEGAGMPRFRTVHSFVNYSRFKGEIKLPKEAISVLR